MKVKEIEVLQDQANLKFTTAKEMIRVLDEACKQAKGLGMSQDDLAAWRDEVLELVTGE